MIRSIAAALFATLMAGSALAQTNAPVTGGLRPTMPTTTPSPAPMATTKPATGATSTSVTASQYATEGAAKSACPTDTIVWANLGGSKAYHLAGDKYYGKTKKGTYMCQKDADASGFHAGGKHGAKTASAAKSK